MLAQFPDRVVEVVLGGVFCDAISPAAWEPASPSAFTYCPASSPSRVLIAAAEANVLVSPCARPTYNLRETLRQASGK